MKKWIKGVLICVLVFMACGGIFGAYYYLVWMKMSPSMAAGAEKALVQGITLDDEQNDFVIMGSNNEVPNENNPSPYRIPYLDIKTVEVGANADWLYFKVIFNGTIPTRPDSIDGDYLHAIGARFTIMNAEGENQIILTIGTGWQPVIHVPSTSTYYFWGPTGIEWPENQRFIHQDSDSKVAGGAGTDYLMGALPMKKLGLLLGQTIYFCVEEETGSTNFTHAAVDVLLGSGKMPAVIKWEIGSDTYQIVN